MVHGSVRNLDRGDDGMMAGLLTMAIRSPILMNRTKRMPITITSISSVVGFSFPIFRLRVASATMSTVLLSGPCILAERFGYDIVRQFYGNTTDGSYREMGNFYDVFTDNGHHAGRGIQDFHGVELFHAYPRQYGNWNVRL